MRHMNRSGHGPRGPYVRQRRPLNVRYSYSSEFGFMPQNLPGFGFNHDNLAQNGVGAVDPSVHRRPWSIPPRPAVSRLAMFHYSENNGVNDIVGELGIQGVASAGRAPGAHPTSTCRATRRWAIRGWPHPCTYGTRSSKAGDALSWQRGRHSLKFGGSYRWYVWPMWALVQSRGYYQFTSGFTTETATNDGTGSALASFLLGLPASRQLQAGVPTMDLRQWSADAFVQDTWRMTRAHDASMRVCAMNSWRPWPT